MTVVGLSKYSGGWTTITSVGTSTDDGWVEVARMSGTDIGSGKRAFAVYGNMCGISSPLTAPDALVQVAIGTGSARFTDTIQGIWFNGNLLFGRQAIGFQIVRVHAGSPALNATWSSANDLVLYARIAQNGPTQVAGAFVVSDVAIQCFNLDELTGSLYGGIIHTTTGGAVQYGGAAAAGLYHFQSIATWPSASWKVDRTWVVFFGHYDIPDGNDFARSVLQFQYRPDNTQGNTNPEFWPSGSKWYSHARRAYGTTRSTSQGNFSCCYQHGGFFELVTSTSHANPEMRLFGISGSGATLGADAYHYKTEWFAIDSSLLGQYDYQEVTADEDLHNEGGVALANVGYEPHETTRSSSADVEYMWAADSLRTLHNTLYLQNPSVNHAYRMATAMDSGRLEQVDYAAQFRNLEMHSTHQSFHAGILRPDEIQARLFGWGLGTGTGKSRQARLVRSMHWEWENQPDYVSYVTPSAGATVYIQPGYEGLGLSSLNEITVEPEGAYNERAFDPKARLETDLGYEPTWPSFTTGRRRFELRWSGLTRAERDTLDAFLVLQSNTVFKWTRPGAEYSAMALVPVGRFRTTPQGVTYAASLDVVELVWLAP